MISRVPLIVMVLLCTYFSFQSILGQSRDSLTNAEQAYQSDNFEASIQYLELTISGGISNGEIFYNLANAYFENGNVGKAILNYRRAMLFSPRDIDLNIQLARARALRNEITPETTHWIIILEQLTENIVTINELSVVTLMVWSSFWLCLAGMGAVKRWRRSLRMVAIFLLVVSLTFIIFLGSRLYIQYQMLPAVVTVDSTPIYSGPSIAYFNQYDMFMGSEIYVTEEDGEWLKFVTPDRRQGWIQRTAIEYLFPQ